MPFPRASVVVFLLMLLASSVWVYAASRPLDPDHRRFPIRGIDVSHYQGTIDWSAVAGSGEVAFAYLKATEGADVRDPRFVANWTAARAAGVPTGAYHYFTLCRPGADQAEAFIRLVPRGSNALPPAVDLEFDGNCPARPTPQAFGRELSAWIQRVGSFFGRDPVLYTTRDFYEAYLRGRSDRMWIRDLDTTPRLPAGQPWVLWQFTDQGRVPGIAGPVDRSVFAGDATAWRRFVGAG